MILMFLVSPVCALPETHFAAALKILAGVAPEDFFIFCGFAGTTTACLAMFESLADLKHKLRAFITQKHASLTEDIANATSAAIDRADAEMLGDPRPTKRHKPLDSSKEPLPRSPTVASVSEDLVGTASQIASGGAQSLSNALTVVPANAVTPVSFDTQIETKVDSCFGKFMAVFTAQHQQMMAQQLSLFSNFSRGVDEQVSVVQSKVDKLQEEQKQSSAEATRQQLELAKTLRDLQVQAAERDARDTEREERQRLQRLADIKEHEDRVAALELALRETRQSNVISQAVVAQSCVSGGNSEGQSARVAITAVHFQSAMLPFNQILLQQCLLDWNTARGIFPCIPFELQGVYYVAIFTCVTSALFLRHSPKSKMIPLTKAQRDAFAALVGSKACTAPKKYAEAVCPRLTRLRQCKPEDDSYCMKMHDFFSNLTYFSLFLTYIFTYFFNSIDLRSTF